MAAVLADGLAGTTGPWAVRP